MWCVHSLSVNSPYAHNHSNRQKGAHGKKTSTHLKKGKQLRRLLLLVDTNREAIVEEPKHVGFMRCSLRVSKAAKRN